MIVAALSRLPASASSRRNSSRFRKALDTPPPLAYIPFISKIEINSF
jgi:hypothetical protein